MLDASEVERVLVVTAHPDDVDFGASGTIASFVDAGVQVSYCQVARPADPLGAALGWTFASVSASADSFAELQTKYATFEDLRLDKRK